MSMAIIQPETFQKHLQSGKIEPVYLFYGSEDYLIKGSLKQITDKLISKEVRDFNYDLLYGEEVTGETIIGIATSFPMMAQRRLVIVQHVDRLNEAGKRLLLRYVENPAPQTVLVLVSDRNDLKKFHNDILKKAVGVPFKPLTETKILQWIFSHVRERGKEISPKAAQLLVARMGRSLQDIANEIDKLVQYAKNQIEITEETVEKVVGISRTFNIFEVWDSLGEKKFARSVAIVRRMLEVGDSPVYMVTMLTSYFSKLARVKALQKKGASVKDIAVQTHTPPYFVNKYIAQAGKYTESELIRNFQFLLEADRNLKSHYQHPRLIMDLLVYHLTHANKNV
ncbi:MAG: DNA polymerase III subunit delta [Calditrichaeota bacterium]|nr:DNA polymerase III subunit delta [Calditrichota bacterium]